MALAASPITSAHPGMSRRNALRTLLGLGLLVAGGGACSSVEDDAASGPSLPRETPSANLPAQAPYTDNVDALFDVLIPAEVDGDGKIVVSGAREVHADRVLAIDAFVPLAIAAGLLPDVPEQTLRAFSNADGAARVVLNAELDALAALERPLTSFRDLPRAIQDRVVDGAFASDAHRPAMLVVRAAALTAWAGALFSDAGLRAMGFPAFESFEDGLCVSGYPRTRSGRLVDATKEDLGALAAKAELDDYTYNRAPEPTPSDDLSRALDENGDLLG